MFLFSPQLQKYLHFWKKYFLHMKCQESSFVIIRPFSRRIFVFLCFISTFVTLMASYPLVRNHSRSTYLGGTQNRDVCQQSRTTRV